MTARKFLAMDIEVAALNLDSTGDWKAHRPLGITCAATVRWVEWSDTYIFDKFNGGRKINQYLPRMSRDECIEMVHFLQTAVRHGYTPLTHNGVGFDFDVLAEESGMHQECVQLAMNSADLCLQALCIKGYPIGLDAICKGLGLEGKPDGMTGAKAPELWASGEYNKVLSYVQQDVRCTLAVALKVERRGSLAWVARSGRFNTMPIDRILTARECLQLEKPDTGWMSGDRLTREKVTAWMQVNQPD